MNTRPNNPNLAPLIHAVTKLEPLLNRIVFVGGCVTGLLVSDPAAASVRPTVDVDAIVEIASYDQFRELENELSRLGFRNETALICRWFTGELILDIMPVDASILGFSNPWYGLAFKNAQTTEIGEHTFRVITAPYFLATKLEAFRGRGQQDFRMSHDLEDIITIIDGRSELIDEISRSERNLKDHLSTKFRDLLASPEFRDALPGHLLPDVASQQRISIVLKRIQQIIDVS